MVAFFSLLAIVCFVNIPTLCNLISLLMIISQIDHSIVVYEGI